MYYYSLEKYYKKPEQPILGSPKEYLKKISSVNDVLLTDSDIKGLKSKKEKSTVATALNKDLFKRIRYMNSDFSEALEAIFSYQFNMNGFTLSVLKVVEKLLEKTNKPASNDFTIVEKPTKQSPTMAARPTKSPLEIEVTSIIYNVQKMQDELSILVNDVIPQKEKSIARAKGTRTPHSEIRISSPFNKHDSSMAFETRTNKSQTPSQRPSKLMKPKMKINLQKIYEQDQKENNSTQMTNTNTSYRFIPTSTNSPPMKIKVEPPSRETRKLTHSSHSKRNTDITNKLLEESNILTELKNESQKNISDKISAKIGLDIVPNKEVDEDDASSQSCICNTDVDVPILLPQRVNSEKAPSRLQTAHPRDDPVDLIKRERTVIKNLLKSHSSSFGSPNLKNQATDSRKRYLIDVKWWIAWKEYVNFDSSQMDESRTLIQNYPRPGMIINKDLLNQDHLNQDSLEPSHIDLKDHLLEHHDFVAVSKGVFDALAGWYSCDYEIMRVMKPDPSHPDKFYLDLFPKRKAKKGKL